MKLIDQYKNIFIKAFGPGMSIVVNLMIIELFSINIYAEYISYLVTLTICSSFMIAGRQVEILNSRNITKINAHINGILVIFLFLPLIISLFYYLSNQFNIEKVLLISLNALFLSIFSLSIYKKIYELNTLRANILESIIRPLLFVFLISFISFMGTEDIRIIIMALGLSYFIFIIGIFRSYRFSKKTIIFSKSHLYSLVQILLANIPFLLAEFYIAPDQIVALRLIWIIYNLSLIPKVISNQLMASYFRETSDPLTLNGLRKEIARNNLLPAIIIFITSSFLLSLYLQFKSIEYSNFYFVLFGFICIINIAIGPIIWCMRRLRKIKITTNSFLATLILLVPLNLIFPDNYKAVITLSFGLVFPSIIQYIYFKYKLNVSNIR